MKKIWYLFVVSMASVVTNVNADENFKNEVYSFSQNNGAVCVGLGGKVFPECYEYGISDNSKTKKNGVEELNTVLGDVQSSGKGNESPEPTKEFIEQKSDKVEIISSAVERKPSTPQPDNSCSPDERDSHAFAACAIVMGGCEIAKNEINKGAGLDVKMASAQACGALEAKLKNVDYGLDQAVFVGFKTVAGDYAGKAVESDSLLEWGVGLAIKGGLFLDKVARFKDCMDKVSNQCSGNYEKWLNSGK